MIAGTAVALLLLTGCSASQSTTEACEILKTGLETVSTELGEASDQLTTDPTVAAQSMATAAANYASTTATITNEEVGVPAVASSDAVTDFSDAVSAIADDVENADIDALTASLEVVQTSFSALQQVCGS
jgi:hypothetical protein